MTHLVRIYADCKFNCSYFWHNEKDKMAKITLMSYKFLNFFSSKLMEADERNVRLANENEELRDKYSKVVDKQQLTECKFTINICSDLVP